MMKNESIQSQEQRTKMIENLIGSFLSNNQNTSENDYDVQQAQQLLINYKLINAILAAEHINSGALQFKKIMDDEYFPFCNQEKILKDEVEVWRQLDEIYQELVAIGRYPSFYQKRAIAVAGGFSAGKSAFISSLFTDT